MADFTGDSFAVIDYFDSEGGTAGLEDNVDLLLRARLTVEQAERGANPKSNAQSRTGVTNKQQQASSGRRLAWRRGDTVEVFYNGPEDLYKGIVVDVDKSGETATIDYPGDDSQEKNVPLARLVRVLSGW